MRACFHSRQYLGEYFLGGRMDGKQLADRSILNGFRAIVKTDGYANITVSKICEAASVSRNCFYTYFDNKYAVLDAIVYEDAAYDTEQAFPMFSERDYGYSPELLTRHMYEGIYRNRDFYTRIVADGGATDLDRSIRACVTRLHCALTKKDLYVNDDRIRYARVCGEGAQSAVIIRWIQDGMKVSPSKLAEWTSDWTFRCGSVGFDAEGAVYPKRVAAGK
jgi:AcrR family transcriptional regulator